MRAIEPFDIELFRGLLDEYIKESKKIEGQEVFMLIGPTGSGKSTTLHYLSGSSMQRAIFHTDDEDIEHITFSDVSDHCYDQQALKQVEISARMISCTKYIKAIKFKFSEEDMMICDCPGLEDTRGPELDIANIYGVVLAAQSCKSIVPVIVLSKIGMGDRMTEFRRISQSIASLFRNIK